MKNTYTKIFFVITVLALGAFAHPKAASAAILPADANVPAGEYHHNFKLSFTTNETQVGTTIIYTTDGSTPRCALNGTLFSDPIVVSSDTTFKTRTCVLNLRFSVVQTFAYTLTSSNSGGGVPSNNTTEVPGNPGCTDNAALCPPDAPLTGTAGTVLDAPVYADVIASGVNSFTRDLTIGLKGEDVTFLQNFLISHRAGTAAVKLASVGATGNFGSLTQAAVVEFQGSNGIFPKAGYVGTKTRMRINAIAGILPSVQTGTETVSLTVPQALVAPLTGTAIEFLSAPSTAGTY